MGTDNKKPTFVDQGSLIGIKEPLKTCKDTFVGIDFGTTNSLVGVFEKGNTKIISHDSCGTKKIPTVVAIKESEFCVGKSALQQANSVFSIKRLLGKDLNSLFDLYPMLRVSSSSNLSLKIGEKELSAIEIASKIFSQLKLVAQKYTNKEIENAIVTVPARFDDSSRSAVKDAARIAGFKKIRLLSEPTAAALFYGVDNKKDSGNYVVYDLGGGTFDVSILSFYKGIFKVSTTDGDDLLGGDDFDKLIFDFLCKKYSISDLDQASFKNLMQIAKILKEDLHKKDDAAADFTQDGRLYSLSISKSDFESLILPKVEKTIEILLNAVKNSSYSIAKIDGVLLVGGSTRIPLIKNKLEEVFGREKILCDSDPDIIVAKGATLYSSFVSGENPEKTVLLDVLPLSLGIETFGGATEVIIEKDSHIPISHSQIFTNFADFQTTFSINVVQGEREFAKDNRSLAEFKLKNIPPLPAGKARIEIIFSVDENGILDVTAKELTKNIVQKIEVNPAHGLNKDSVDKMIKDSYLNLKSDSEAISLLNARNYAKKVLGIIKNALQSSHEMLKADEEENIKDKIKSLESIIDLKDSDKINSAVTELEFFAKDFLQRRLSSLLKKMKVKALTNA